MQIAVIGGGINGLCTAWQLAQAGHTVTLFERDQLMQATSQASTKLLHGGLRYLEHLEFALVREGLQERAWWLAHVPGLTSTLRLILPLYRSSHRTFWKIKLGLWLYDRLAGRHNLGPHRWYSAEALGQFDAELHTQGLLGAFTFSDAQMDDYRLGLWVADQARATGVRIQESCPVTHVCTEGRLTTPVGESHFDTIINAAGPWTERLLTTSGITPRYRLDLIRGSHILFANSREAGYLLPVPGENRIFFVLPYKGQTLVGTTEVRQGLDEPIECSDAEASYLLNAYNTYFQEPKGMEDIKARYAGLRPLVYSTTDPTQASREYVIERQGRLITLYGGKWTTARALARAVAAEVEHPNKRIKGRLWGQRDS